MEIESTHKNGSNPNDITKYKVVYEKLFWCIYIERVYFYDPYQGKWIIGAFSKEHYGLVKIDS